MFDTDLMRQIKRAILSMTTPEQINGASKAVQHEFRARFNDIVRERARAAQANFVTGQRVWFEIKKGRLRGRRIEGTIESMNPKTVTVKVGEFESYRCHPSILNAVEDKPGRKPAQKSGGLVETPMPGSLPVEVTLVGGPRQIEDFAEAARLVREEIDTLGVGGTEWGRAQVGKIFSAGGVQIAFVSYNGRVWKGIDNGRAGHEEIKLSA